NIILIGPTGVGKTEIARRLAKLTGAPFVKVEATRFTEVGYVGRDVESMVRELVEAAVSLVRAEKMAEVRHEARKAAEQRLLDLLVPPPRAPGLAFSTAGIEEFGEHRTARTRVYQQLQSGELDDQLIEIDIQADPVSFIPFVTSAQLTEELGDHMRDLLRQLMPRHTRKRKLKISEARTILEQEEASKLIDMDAVVQEALFRAENLGIIFIDEIDKIASPGGTRYGPDVSREGVQRDLLPIVEGATVRTKYGPVRTDHVLFIAAGAFHTSKPSDLIPELQGRFPIRVELHSLTEEDFVRILTQPENALTKQYQALLATEGIQLEFTEDAVREIAATAARVNQNVANIGARRLQTVLSTVLADLLFAAPDKVEPTVVRVDTEYVRSRISTIVDNTDLSRFIL
ncbi:MAG: ATP-dependent protease ATPase subunit HslU, partial [Candidatus Kapabacteria bacterium]|nr:ATP-dependent protease ATPase subunit HslU [Candidatus Kapabacteria bacterium]MDW7997491.1 ATP-dependent protease ATPase subunit HslU [Bacteroidota bacterium]